MEQNIFIGFMIEVATKHVYCLILLTISGAKNNARISPADIFTD